ncbi:hypothetical protein A3F28_02905 [Candidatus Uhrbacteria bacterium RIFCSPHIGHO2_12_FULL_57_11]|uniref:NYN domain-containing protein n=2 Tax=Candidatus Uhriibacteriota TaxID=1752732 RepID=A0A1F7UNM3_9BACT|nr:MAG: hypothetical protein A3D72_04555 [Candidatus Uhrbacteria bacterium RIFCSPHIGHO2_02_FULL_57_19]OGL79308.1 MAG: hypothetical protein A3F28_02905 [Candidatus Uhrbacteria bacterium RIFCSPHIGHO2_12_FULL_57_11]
MIKHPSQRVGVFIDAANMYHSAKNVHNARVNFKNLLEDAVDGRQLVRAIAYVVKTKTGEEKPFFEALAAVGIETKEKELQEFFGGAKKADWDVGIAVDAIRIADLLDVVILVSGDGDFIPLAEYLRNQGRQVEVVSFRSTTSSKLIEMTDGFMDLSADPDRYLIGAGRGRAGRAMIIRSGGKKEPV